MRIALALPLVLLASACNVSKDDNAVTVQYDQNTAENAAADISNTAQNIGADIANDVQKTGDKIDNRIGDGDGSTTKTTTTTTTNTTTNEH
jgi:hypothetical protein